MDPTNDLSLYSDIRDRDLKREGILVAEGRHLAVRLLASGLDVLSILCSERMADEFRALAGGRFPVHVLDNERMESFTGFPFHRGVMAAATRPAVMPLGRFLADNAACRSLVICPRLSGGENLGSILRTSAALGADGVVIGRRSCDPFSRKALKASMGAAFSMPVVMMENEGDGFTLLKERGFTLYGASTGGSSIPLDRARRSARRAVVFGNEAEGIDEGITSQCDEIVHVPMHNNTDSLNVAVAAGIILHALSGPR